MEPLMVLKFQNETLDFKWLDLAQNYMFSSISPSTPTPFNTTFKFDYHLQKLDRKFSLMVRPY